MSDTVSNELPLDADLRQAIVHHQAGRFEEAEDLYMGILQTQPYHAVANHNMGLLAGQVGQPAAGLPYLRKALSVNPDEGQFWLSYGAGLLASGQAELAMDIIQTAIRRGLDTAPALALLHSIETHIASAAASTPRADESDVLIALFNAGRYAELESATRLLIEAYPDSALAWSILGTALHVQGKDGLAAMQKTVELAPHDVEALSNLGNALQASGQLLSAQDIYRRALTISPDSAEVHCNLGVALQAMGQFDGAVASYRQALKNKPDYEMAYFNLGNSLTLLGQFDEAVENYRCALALGPGDSRTHISLGNALAAAGQQDEAIDTYRHALEITPDSALAHGGMGRALFYKGDFEAAAARFRRSIDFAPYDAEMHGELGNVLHHLERNDEAIASCRQALSIAPDFAGGHRVLGTILQSQGKLDQAVASYRQSLALQPHDTQALYGLGGALHSLGQFEQALPILDQALTLSPNNADMHTLKGSLLKMVGKGDAAADSYRRALDGAPDSILALNNLGTALSALKQFDEAIALHCRALQLEPDCATSHINLGFCLQALARFDEGALHYRKALEFAPTSTLVFRNLSSVLLELKQTVEATELCRQGLAINPDDHFLHYNLGTIQVSCGLVEEAITSFHKALEIKPDFFDALNNLSVAFIGSGKVDEAMASCRAAIQMYPDYAAGLSNLLFCLSHSATMGSAELFAEHCRFGAQFEPPLRARWPHHTNGRDPERRLQVGFVSADFNNHAVASFLEPILVHLQHHSGLTLHAYYNKTLEDHVTEQLRKLLPHWHNVVELDDEAMARRIQDDGIDILIDLSGHTSGNRLLAFARKPAPVQLSWMGYPGTTGLQAMDYFMSDGSILPEGKFDQQFTEKIVRLPVVAPFLPVPGAPDVAPLPAIRNGYLTFGSFNRASKLNHSVITMWSKLLRALPNSRMILAGLAVGSKNDILIDWFAQEGVARERLSFYPRSTMGDYLSLHQQVDVCLNPFPYTGGTTLCHALWMGVPTLTRTGDTIPARAGAAFLGHVGLDSFVAQDEDDFVRKGVFLSSNTASLSSLRQGMRDRFMRSALGRPDIVAAALDMALRAMWRRWCADLPAESFQVTLNDCTNSTREDLI